MKMHKNDIYLKQMEKENLKKEITLYKLYILNK